MDGERPRTLALLALVWAAGGVCAVSSELPQDCKDDAECCRGCPPGTYMETVCSRGEKPQCRACPPETHSENWNKLRQCSSCRAVCREELGLVEMQACTNTSRRRCACKVGSFCRKEMRAEDSSCSDCEPHKACPPGQGVIRPGNHSSDTQCGKCPPGTFSNRTSTTDRCVLHTNCSSLGRSLRTAGNGTSDSVCGQKVGDVMGRASSQQPGDARPRVDDSAPIPNWIPILLLFVAASATIACLLQGVRKLRGSLHVSCFKRVFKSCVIDPEAHLPDHNSPDAARSDDFLFPPAPAVGTEAPPLQEHCLACPPSASSPQEELLRGRAQEPLTRPAVNHSTIEVPVVASQGTESGSEQAAGFVGPVFIYNPACVYMGLIQSRELTDPAVEEEEEEEAAAVLERGVDEARSLPYPQQEAGGRGTLRQSGPRPEQETGKGEHLSEEASEVP